MKIVLGLKLDPWHDTGAAIVMDDGSRLRVVAISQERLDRVKKSRAFPAEAIAYCLESVGCRLSDVTLVVSDFIVSPAVDDRATWVEQPEPDAKRKFFAELEKLSIPTHFAEHHLCHAASAYFATTWDEAAALVIDGLGSNYETQTIFNCKGNVITKLATSRKPGIGLMYSAVTELLLGFQHLEEGKSMGLAGHASDGGSWSKYFSPVMDAENPCQIMFDEFVEQNEMLRLTAPSQLKKRTRTDDPVSAPFPQYAYAAQTALESGVMHLARAAAEMTSSRRLCYSGGVALNIPANRMILDSGLYDDLFIQPAASDAGIPLGAALLGYYSMLSGTLRWDMEHAFLGKEYPSSALKTAVSSWNGPGYEYNLQSVAQILANDYLIAWVQGASEFGPRALGHRSILCLPRDPLMKAYLNREVKHREMFRPFAPIVPEEEQSKFFDLDTPSPYMLINTKVAPAVQALIPAVVHADGTARVQCIRREQSELHALLHAVGNKTGVPVLLNTSLNLGGEPIIETPAEAVDLFQRSRLDALVLGTHLLTKKPLQEMLAHRNPGLIAMHAEHASQVTTDCIEPEAANTGDKSSTAEEAEPLFNILFYVDPLLDNEKEPFIRGCHYIATTIINSLNKNPRVRLNVRILGNATVRAIFGEGFDASFREIEETLFLDYYKNTARYEIIEKAFRGEHDEHALAYFADSLKKTIGDFKPNIMVSCTPMPFLQKIFPDALMLYAEAGLMTTLPVFYSLLFDPSGLLNNSLIERHAREILGRTLPDKESRLLKTLKEKFREAVILDNPFDNEIKALKERHEKLVLLSLPFLIDIRNDQGIDFEDVEELLFTLLRKIDTSIGVLITTHPHEKNMSPDIIAKVEQRFPNVTFLAKKHHYFTSLHVMPFVDAVINIWSKTAIWTLFFDKKLLSIGKSFSALSDWASLEDFDINTSPAIDKEPFLYYLLSRYYVPEKYYTDVEWMTAFLQRSLRKIGHGVPDADFFDAIDGDTAILEDLIGRIDGFLAEKRKGEASALEFTGERFVPEVNGQIAYEHFHRYAFASEFVKNKRVLDIASGEGYGSALLAKSAREVIGVDISTQAVDHAIRKYAGIKNLTFMQGECKKIPCPDRYFDVVVSFETLEHTKDQSDFLSEIKRVLAKDGILLISTPNKQIYSDDRNFANPYHLLELNKEEFYDLLRCNFKNARLWGQRLTFSSHLWPMGSTDVLPFKHYTLSSSATYSSGNEPPFEAEYYIAVCSDSKLSVKNNYISLYTGEQNEVLKEFARREEWGKALEREVAVRDAHIKSLQERQPQQGYDKVPDENNAIPAENAVSQTEKENSIMERNLMHAQELIQSGKLDEALGILTELVQHDPNHAAAHAMLGSLYDMREDKVRSLMHYERAVALDSQNINALRSLADTYYVNMGRVEDAQMLYCRILAMNPDEVETLQILANICVSQKQFHAAAAFFRKLLGLKPDNVDAKQAMEAIENYHKKAEAQTAPEFLHKEALVIASTGMIEDAINLLQGLIETCPDFALAHNDLGVLHASNGDYESAQACYRRAVALAPENMTFQKNLADLLLAAFNKYDDAIAIYWEILKSKPDDQDALVALSETQAMQNAQGMSQTDHSTLKKNLKVVLLQVPAWGLKSPPYALACLTAYLKAKGIDVIQRDLNIEIYQHFKGTIQEKLWTLNEPFWGDVEKVSKFVEDNVDYFNGLFAEILSGKPDVIGFSVLWSMEPMAILFARNLKRLAPHLKIVFGGPQCARQIRGSSLASLPEVDFVVHGEGEAALHELLDALASHKNVAQIRSVFSKQGAEVVYGGDRELIQPLDTLPFADFSGFDFSLYVDPTIPASTSRGCPNHCIYCDEKMFWHTFRSRSAKRIFAEVSHQYKKYGIKKFEFVDSLVNGNIKALEEFCDLVIEEKLPIAWMGQAAVRKEMTREVLAKIKKSGCFHLCFGVEHSSEELMFRMGKVLCKGADFDRLVRDAHDVGLGIGLNWMFGFPGETEDDFQGDLDFFTRNQAYLRGSIVNNSPGFCGFTAGCYAYAHPAEFDVILGRDACTWKTKDGSNTYVTRLQKFQRFARHLESLGIRCGFPAFKNENELIGNYYFAEKDYGNAVQFFQASLEIEGSTEEKLRKLCEARHGQALVLANAGRTEEAITVLETLTAQQPHYAVARNDLGVLYSRKGDLDKAREYYEQAVSLNPANITFAKNLAGLYLALNNFEGAALIYDRVLEDIPDDVESLAGMGKISVESAQYETACFFFEKLLEINPQNEVARQCLDALKAGKSGNAPLPLPEQRHSAEEPSSPPHDCSMPGQTEPRGMLALYQLARTVLGATRNTRTNGKCPVDMIRLEKEIHPLLLQCNYMKAVAHCMEAVHGNEENPRFLLLLGNLYHRAGHNPEAAFFFERAAQHAKNDLDVLRRVDMFRRAAAVVSNSRTDIENFCDPDVILIQAPGWGVNTPPLGTAMLASFARSRAYKVLPLDLNVEFYLKRPKEFENTWELEQSLCFWNTRESVERMMAAFSKKIDDFIELLLATNAKVIGFTIYNSSSHISLELARKLKAARPGLTIVFGGPDVSRFATGPSIVKDGAVDAAAHGEGELTLVDILERVKTGRSLADCPGLLVRTENGVIDTGDREVIQDLDAIPAPDFSDYAFEQYRTPTRLPLSSSRGCVNQCIFCNERPFWKQYRHRSADNVFAEIKFQLERYPFINFLDFQDSLVNGKINELERLADLLIKNNMQMQWAGQAVIRKEMTAELMTKLKQSGCVCMAYGLETPSTSLMLKVGKVISRGADVNAIAEAHGKTGLGVAYNFMFGLPGETEEDALEAHEFLRRNRKYNIFVNPSPSFCGFAPGSFAYENPEKYGIDLSRGGTYWKSKDGTNTYPIRLKRFEDFCCLVKELGISTTYPSTALLDRNRMLGNYYFDMEDHERARWYYRAWLADHPDDADIRTRMERITTVNSPKNVPEDKHINPQERALEKSVSISRERPKGIICLNPFYEFEIDLTGRVVVCCTAWLKQSLGNMKKQSIAEVWNSQVARYIRRKMYKGEWEDICNASCPTIVQYRKYGTLIPYSELHKDKHLTPKHIEEILAGKDCLESKPTLFKLSDSKVCNLACKMCGVIKNKDIVDDQQMIEKRAKDIVPYLATAKTILMCGNGDPFARKDTRELLINYNGTNPDLKFAIITNGLLLPKYWDKVKHQPFESIDISIDAARKETYEKIRIGGTWEKLLEVLDLVKKNRDRFGNVLISMVVMRSNYREIPAFNDLAESYGFLPMYSRIHGMFDDENIFEMNDRAALDELRKIVTSETRKKRSVNVIWQDIIEFADECVGEEACLVNS